MLKNADEANDMIFLNRLLLACLLKVTSGEHFGPSLGKRCSLVFEKLGFAVGTYEHLNPFAKDFPILGI